MSVVLPLVFPTPVGMSRASRRETFFWLCVPHASGDEPTFRKWVTAEVLCSPRQWG